MMLRNFYLAYLGYLTQLCLGGGEFDNVTQNLGGGGVGQVGVNLSKISAIQNADQNHGRDRDARGI